VTTFSESAGRFIVTIDPDKREAFEDIFQASPCACIGTVTDGSDLVINGMGQQPIVRVPVADLKTAWKKPFGDLI
jgi:phosphoribosylformylglycinamidine (FGAM) synthase-like enzyme